MTILHRIRAFVRWLFRRHEIEQAIVTDLEDYIERSAAEKIRGGMSEAEAKRSARIELGGVEQTTDRVRDIFSLGPVQTIAADFGYGLRALCRQRTFTAVVVLTLALGIGVNVAMFSLAEHILLRPLPVPEPDRLVNLIDPGAKQVGRMDPMIPPITRGSVGGGMDTVFSYPMFRDLEREQEPFVGLAAHTFFEPTLSIGERAQLATGVFVSGSYFSVLDLRPALGRLLGPEDDRVDGQAESVVLSHAYWLSELGGDPDVLGRTLSVNDIPLTIVGVAPEGFHGTAVSARASVFVPLTVTFSADIPELSRPYVVPNHDRRDYYWVHLFARLRPGFSRDSAAAVMNPLFRAIASDIEAPLLNDVDPQDREAFQSRPLVLEAGARGQTTSEVLLPASNRLKLLFAAGGLVLLLCCSNVAGLMLIRATTRSSEIAVRASMGATRGRIVSLQFAETIMLALPAALLSLPVGWLTLFGASQVPGIAAAAPLVSLSGAAVVVAISVAVVTALTAGLVPLRGLLRTEPVKALQADGARRTTSKSIARFRAALATAQVALSMALLAMMGVFVQSLANIGRVDPGADFASVVMFSIAARGDGSSGGDSALVEALEAIPGVSSVASSSRPLLSPAALRMDATVGGVEAEVSGVLQDLVGPGFFELFGVQVLAGREFNYADGPAFGEAIVNQRFVENLGLAPEAVIGRSLESPPFEIIGVVSDLKSVKVTDEIEPQLFLPLGGGPTFYVRSALPGKELLSTIRDAVGNILPNRPITNLRTMEQQFRESIAIERFVARTSVALALLATGLAALGLYGVLAYSVAQRSREIALRFALGAQADRIRRMVLRQVTGMAVVGIALGVVAAFVLGRAAQGLLFGIEPGDPLVLAAAAVVLTAVTLGAAYLPARRASRVDPMTVLRYE